MSKATKPEYPIVDEELINEALDIAHFFYRLIPDFPEEEKWRTVSKTQNAASDFLYFTAQATGNGSPASREFDWGSVRRNVVTLQTLYRFAHKQGYVQLDPDMMLRLKKLVKLVDEQLELTYRETRERGEKDMKEWRDKYELWKKAEKESDK